MTRLIPEMSPQLRQVVAELGPAAQRWLDQAPAQLDHIAEEWQLTLHPQLHHSGATSIVFPVTTSAGEPAILKHTVPHDDALGEAAALRRWDGDGAARLLRSTGEGLTLLLERCQPGDDLWSLPVDQQIHVVAGLLPQLWVEPDGLPIRELDDTVAAWRRRMRERPDTFDAPHEVIATAARWADQLHGTSTRRVMLHGDLNPGNVLTAERARWLAIDPKPWLGDPAFDLAQALLNWISRSDAQVGEAVDWATRLAQELQVDVARALRWATVKALGWGDGRVEATILHDAALAVRSG